MEKPLYFHKLDAIRGAACFYILMHNFVYGLYGENLVPFSLKALFAAGQEIVMVFFIMSGFVVRLSTFRYPHLTFKDYFIKRFRRIYFPLSVAMLVSLIIVYSNGSLEKIFSPVDVAGNVLLLQDFGSVKPGTWFYPFLGNLPLWSLSYEWWFYMMFYPVCHFLPKTRLRIYYVLAFSAVSYLNYIFFPNQISLICSYFIIWWSGVEAATIFVHDSQLTARNCKPILISLLVMAFITALPLLGVSEFKPGYYPFLMFRHFFAAFAMFVVGLCWYQKHLICFDRILAFFTPLAPLSYSLYILTFPLLVQWNLTSDLQHNWWLYLINFAALFGLAYLIDIKLQPIVNRWIQ